MPGLLDAPLPGIEEDELEHDHPLGSRRQRTRSSRTCGGEENQNPRPNGVHPNPKRSESVSGSTGSTRTAASVHTHTYAYAYAGPSCKRPLRSTGTLSGNGAAAYAYDAQQAHTHPGDDLPVHVPRARPAPATSARPRHPAREQEREQGDSEFVRRKSWLSVLSPKKLFSTRKRRSIVPLVAEADASLDRSYLTNENEYASANANTKILGRTHAAHVHMQKREVCPAEWRAYGMWARPWLGKEYGEIIVRNATPLDPPRELSPPQVEAMIATLWEDESPHPDRWIPRVQHLSLPPRPDLWPTPRLTYDPLPEELQLNPFLVHNLMGRPPLHFDLRLRAEDITLGERPPAVTPYTRSRPGANHANSNLLPWLPAHAASASDSSSDSERAAPSWCDGPNGAQPATYPGVPRLRITALAGDAQHSFPWPVTVLPHHEALPVLVADVVHALVANFEERLASAEVEALSDGRRVMLYQAYWRRMRLPVGGHTPPESDGLRRVDYLGDAVYFRGLEPNPGGDGFVLFMGPPP
ncbi:hypothetical protein LXA43DRAFT_975037 [Ganoderma leucocontextum]|nr:hypothetical protein LXA43DRAFT_975037 [Ganoderma leucocontextum]